MLAERLRTAFNADRISLILFVDADEKITDTGASVHPNLYWAVRQADGNFPEAYQRYCQNKQPYCGELIPQHSTLLFANHPDDIRSMAVLPLVRDDCFGLFAIGSRDRGRFHADIGTTFLAQLGCFLSRALWPYRNIFIS